MLTQPNLLFFTSNIQIDKVLRVEEGSFNVAAPTGGLGDITRDGSEAFSTGIDDTTFFYGIYSIDGGATWNDFNSTVVVISGGFPVFQTCDVWGESTNGTFTVRARNWYNFVSGTGTARTVLWKVAIIAKRDQALVPKGNTNEVLQFTSKYNYQKIAVDDIVTHTLVSGARNTYTVDHSLGYIPFARIFIEEGGIMRDVGNVSSLDAYSSFQISATDVTMIISNENNPSSRTITLHVRIYHDD